MAELVIARVTEQGIQARDLSETFSGDNELVIKGQQGNAGGSCVATLNGISLSPSQTKGLNCIHLTENFTATPMSFDFGIANDTQRFINWVNGLSTGIILLMSHTENVTNDQLNTYFDQIGSIGWKYYWNPAKGTNRSSYVAIIDCPLKKIMTEQFMGHGKTTMQAQLCIVFDTFADIGVTGYGDMLAWEENEVFVETAGYGVIKYIDTKPENINVKPGELIEINAEVWKSKEAHAAGTGSALIVQYWGDPIAPATGPSGSRYISSFSVNAKGVEVWEKGTNTAPVPRDCTRIEATLYRYPNKNSSAKVGIRDVMIKLRKPDVIKPNRTHGTFGQWGFITSTANEGDAEASFVASSKVGELVSQSYEELDQEWLPQFNQTGYFDIPDWMPGSKFEVSQTISYDYPAIGDTWMRSGMGSMTDGLEDKNLKVGIRTVMHDRGEGHYFNYGGLSHDFNARIEYGRPYTYKITVDGSNVKFYLDGVEVKSGVATAPFRQITHFAVGADKRGNVYMHKVRGSIHELTMIDKTRPTGTNDRFYNFVRSGQLDDVRSVPGKSRYSGMEYFNASVSPDSSANALYCGAGSKLVPGGLCDESTDIFVTILDAGGNTLLPGLELNKRYSCVAREISSPRADWVQSTSQYSIRNPLDVNNGAWIVEADGKNMGTMKFKIECVVSPKINGKVTNVDWVNIQKQIARLNGKNQYSDIMPWNGPGEFQIKFNYESTGFGQYILEGRTLTEPESKYGYIYIKTDHSLDVGGFKIATINGMPFVNNMKLTPNTDYVLCGFINQGSRVTRVGARYNNVEYFKGYIWDFSLDGKGNDDRYYKNYNMSRYDAYNNYVKDELAKSDVIVSKTYIQDMSLFTTAIKQNEKSYKFNTATTPSGASLKFSSPKGSIVRIDFDIEGETPFEIRYSPIQSGSAPLIKSLPAGRCKGSIAYKISDEDPGVYVRTIAPKLNEVVKIHKLNVSRVYTDVIIENSGGDEYKLEEREQPVMKTINRTKWIPDYNIGYMHIQNTWKPDPKDWAIRVKCKAGALKDDFNPILSGVLTDTSTINVDQYKSVSAVRVFSYNAKKQLNTGVTLDVGAKVGDDLDIFVKVIDNTVTLTVNGKSTSGAWNPDGTESIGLIGSRQGGARFNNDITLVELIDTSTKLCNSRRYDLSQYSTVKPVDTSIDNELGAIKYIRIGEIDATNKIYGWDGTQGEEKQIGRMKDSFFIDGLQMDLFTTINTSGYSAYLHFVDNKRPFNSVDVELYQIDDNNNEQLLGTFNAVQTINAFGYGIPENAIVTSWFSGLNTNKKVIFRPRGEGALLKLADAKPWVAV